MNLYSPVPDHYVAPRKIIQAGVTKSQESQKGQYVIFLEGTGNYSGGNNRPTISGMSRLYQIFPGKQKFPGN